MVWTLLSLDCSFIVNGKWRGSLLCLISNTLFRKISSTSSVYSTNSVCKYASKCTSKVFF